MPARHILDGRVSGYFHVKTLFATSTQSFNRVHGDFGNDLASKYLAELPLEIYTT
jgi:hypothetical protein